MTKTRWLPCPENGRNMSSIMTMCCGLSWPSLPSQLGRAGQRKWSLHNATFFFFVPLKIIHRMICIALFKTLNTLLLTQKSYCTIRYMVNILIYCYIFFIRHKEWKKSLLITIMNYTYIHKHINTHRSLEHVNGVLLMMLLFLILLIWLRIPNL